MCIFQSFFVFFADETSRHDSRRSPYCFHCRTEYASQHMIGWELSCTCIMMNHNVWFAESSRAPALWRHDRDVNNQNMAMLPIFQGRLAMFTEQNWALNRNVNVTKNMSNWRGRSKDSRQVRFFLIDTFYFFIKLQSPKLNFYQMLI